MTAHDIAKAPIITEMQVIPVAGHDGMLLNLSGAHGPFFTRNIVILKDNAGHTSVARGTTTVVDAGSSGSNTFPGFRRYVIDIAQRHFDIGYVPKTQSVDDFALALRRVELGEGGADDVQPHPCPAPLPAVHHPLHRPAAAGPGRLLWRRRGRAGPAPRLAR